jgi:hypothetical protein
LPIEVRARSASASRGCIVRSTPGEGVGIMNSIIWLVGAVVIILAALSFFGLR